jgi:tetratricopeptide (TPR) repeat protein
MNNINENVFVSSENGYSNTNGILVYASIANIYNTNIQDQNVGVMLTGRSQSILAGTSNFCNEETQVIKNNNICQVYASEYSFPTEFIWNAIYHDTLTKCFVHHDINPNYHHDSVNVTLNYWSDQYNPYNNLIPLGHFYYDSIYDPCSKNVTAGSNAKSLYQSGVNQIADGNYTGAKSTFEELINDYPKTEQANFAMKDIFNLAPLTDNDFSSLRSYYLSTDSIVGNERLEKLGQNLANKCDEKLGNFSNAIDWYEDMIEDPPTLQDSVFAIIDLENCYLQMGIDTSLKSSAYVGRYPQYKQKTVKAHQDHRNKLLALLLKQSTLEEENNTETDNYELSKLAELKQNIPNPFKSSTQISYSLSIDSDVQLTVYNYNGQKLRTIHEGFKPKGAYTIIIDASGLQSGIYFYSISINGHTTDSKKMTLIK